MTYLKFIANRRVLLWIFVLLTITACQRAKIGHQMDAETITLPAPVLEGRLALVEGKQSLEETLAKRHSVRSYTDEQLTKEELAQLLWAAHGITPRGNRTVPSAGALYPLELYVAIPSGFYHYDLKKHEMKRHLSGDLRPEIHRNSLRQGATLDAPAVFIIAAVYERTSGKYGSRATRYVHMEAGHAGQNLILEAVALDLGAVTIGAFSDSGLKEALSLPEDHEPLYVIPVGHPSG